MSDVEMMLTHKGRPLNLCLALRLHVEGDMSYPLLIIISFLILSIVVKGAQTQYLSYFYYHMQCFQCVS